VVAEGVASLTEVCYDWTLVDLARCHRFLNVKAELKAIADEALQDGLKELRGRR
jgi:hypothetical protein